MGFLHIPQLGKVHFHEYGTDARPLLAFHGYGMTGRQFHVLEQSLLKKYHVYGFDHFFHDQSALEGWTEQQILAGMPKALMRTYVEHWFEQFGRQRFSVLGYSIGANLALILVEEFADMIDEVILMAPDGLAVFKGFDIIQNKPWGRMLFKRVTKSSWLALWLLNNLKRVRFIDDSLHQIAYSEMDTPKKRLDVYYTLNLIRLLRPDTDKIAALMNQYNIPCTLIFGQQDGLFPKKPAMPFIQKLNNAQVHELPLGHWLVIPTLDDYLAKLDA